VLPCEFTAEITVSCLVPDRFGHLLRIWIPVYVGMGLEQLLDRAEALIGGLRLPSGSRVEVCCLE
jgi:hypothetical protein